MNEKRRFSRIPFDAVAKLRGPGAELDTQLLDISLNGALISRPSGWNGKIGERYTLELTLDHSNSEISMEIVVAHIDDEHIGCSCEHIDLESIIHLRRLVELNLGNESILDRELHALIHAEQR